MLWPDGSMVRFEYDSDGRVTKLHDWNGGVQSFRYGAREQPLRRRLTINESFAAPTRSERTRHLRYQGW